VTELPTTASHDDLELDRKKAEELQDRLRREHQTATAIRAYLLERADS
jgi:hypothetical protein